MNNNVYNPVIHNDLIIKGNGIYSTIEIDMKTQIIKKGDKAVILKDVKEIIERIYLEASLKLFQGDNVIRVKCCTTNNIENIIFKQDDVDGKDVIKINNPLYIDGVEVKSYDLVLFNNQYNTRQNGIYQCEFANGSNVVLVRYPFYDAKTYLNKNQLIICKEGVVNGAEMYMLFSKNVEDFNNVEIIFKKIDMISNHVNVYKDEARLVSGIYYILLYNTSNIFKIIGDNIGINKPIRIENKKHDDVYVSLEKSCFFYTVPYDLRSLLIVTNCKNKINYCNCVQGFKYLKIPKKGKVMIKRSGDSIELEIKAASFGCKVYTTLNI